MEFKLTSFLPFLSVFPSFSTYGKLVVAEEDVKMAIKGATGYVNEGESTKENIMEKETLLL